MELQGNKEFSEDQLSLLDQMLLRPEGLSLLEYLFTNDDVSMPPSFQSDSSGQSTSNDGLDDAYKEFGSKRFSRDEKYRNGVLKKFEDMESSGVASFAPDSVRQNVRPV